MTDLPADFQFSQTSLHDWQTCKRRFKYRYLDERAYPAPQTADQIEFEQHAQRGDTFHQLVHQHLVGIDENKLAAGITDAQVSGWWEQYLTHGLANIPQPRHAEVLLTAPIGDYRLLAKYDLIAVEPGKRAVIVDWKTSEFRPSRSTLERRMQTIVYRYLLVEAGAYYNDDQPIPLEQVEMVYWFANFPTQPEVLQYSAAQYHEDKTFLTNLVRDIAAESTFPLLPESDIDRVCRFCNYRSLCWENVTAGTLADMNALETESDTEDFDVEIDLDQIAEIEF
ncbi:MAG: PD-(D/E)XK nuclease family protein [Chloroflexota bacterium]